MRIVWLLLVFMNTIWASNGEDLTTTWVGIVSLIVFVVGYYAVATEENYHINKAKPALFMGTFIFILIGVYNFINNIDPTSLTQSVDHLIFEIAEIFFFLFVAMLTFLVFSGAPSSTFFIPSTTVSSFLVESIT